MPEGGLKRNRRPRPTAWCPTVNGAGERATWTGSAGHRRDSKGSAAPVASTAIGTLLHLKPTCPYAHVVTAPVASTALSTSAFSAPLAGDSGYNITTGAHGYGGGDGPYGGGAYGYGYGDGSYGGGAYGYDGSYGAYSDGAYSGGPYNHGGHGGASNEAVPVGQSPGGGGAGYDKPSRPPVAPDRGYHRAIQLAGRRRRRRCRLCG